MASAHDVLADVHCLRHVDSKANHDDVLRQVAIVVGSVRSCDSPLRAMIFSANTTRQSIVDIQREPISLCIYSS